MELDTGMDPDASDLCTPVPWTLSPVDEELPVDDAVVAIDSSGAVRFAYSADTGGGREIRYAFGAPGAWDSETIHSDPMNAGGSDDPIDLVLEGSSPHVAFRERRGVDAFLVHAQREDGVWTTTDIEQLGGDPSLAIDSSGVVHVAYVYFAGWRLRHARREADGSWNVSMLDAPDPDRWPALAADGAGGLHLAYGGEDSLRYAPAFTTAWGPVIVEPAWTVSRTSLAIDGAGAVHLVFAPSGSPLPALVHALLPPGGEWVRAPIDPGDEAVLWPGDLAVDPAGGAHLVYTRTEPGIGMQALRYGHRPAGGTWTTEEAFPAPAPGRTRSLAVDTTGGIHVALFGDDGLHHAYTRRCPPAP